MSRPGDDKAAAFSSGRKGSVRPDDGIAMSNLSFPADEARKRSIAGPSSSNTTFQYGAKKPSNSDEDIYITSKELSPPDTDSDSTTAQDDIRNKSRQSSIIPTPGFHYRAFVNRHRPWVTSAAVIFAISCALIISLTVYFHHKHELALEAQPPVLNVTLTQFSAAADPYNLTTPPVRLAALWNFADPTFYHDADTNLWWAFATNGGAGILRLLPAGSNDSAVQTLLNATGTNRRIPNFQVATSPDFNNWTVLPAANPLPVLGSWVYGTNITVDSTKPNITATISLVPTATTTTSTMFYPYVSTLHPTISLAPTPLTFPTFNYSANSSIPDSGAPPPGPQNITFSTTRGANPWAPEVFKNPNTGQYIMYYCATSADYPSAHCIGASVSDNGIGGPYLPRNESIACPGEWGGAIDPAVFVDDDREIYLLYKVDGNSHGQGGECYNNNAPYTSTPLLLQRMAEDGVTPVGEAAWLLDRETDEGDGPLIEAPSLVKVKVNDENVYVLFYSTGCTRNVDYDIRVVTAPSITGPYTRRGVLLKTDDFGALYAPGSVTVRTSGAYQAGLAGAGDSAVNEMTGVTGIGNAASLGSDNVTAGASNGTGAALWQIMFHARVVTRSGGIRALFTAGLEFVAEEMENLSATVVKGASKERTKIVRLVN